MAARGLHLRHEAAVWLRERVPGGRCQQRITELGCYARPGCPPLGFLVLEDVKRCHPCALTANTFAAGGIPPSGNDPDWFKITTALSGNAPKWAQYPVGVLPGCNTQTS